MMWLRNSLALFFGLCLTSAVFANDPATIRAQMSLGEYSSAYTTAIELKTADAQALAAEILLTEILLGQAEKNKKQAKRARKIAEFALGIDPLHQNARLQYAIADGFITRETGEVSAWMKKLPQKTYVIVQAYRDDFPEDPRGDALLGAWHLAIAKKAGNDNAKKWFRASIDEGRNQFLAAREKRPHDIVISINYAFSLLALKDQDFSHLDEARQILLEISTLHPTDQLGRTLKGYAQEALVRLGDRKRVKNYVRLFLEGQKPE